MLHRIKAKSLGSKMNASVNPDFSDTVKLLKEGIRDAAFKAKVRLNGRVDIKIRIQYEYKKPKILVIYTAYNVSFG
jgi:hypothetical protein